MILGAALSLVVALVAIGLRLAVPADAPPSVDFAQPNGKIRPPFDPAPRPSAGPQKAMTQCSGVTVTPDQDLGAVISAQVRGATICLQAAVYRITEPLTPGEGQTLIGQAGTVIDGSKVVTDWEFDGENWVANGQSQGPTVIEWSGPELTLPQALFGEDLFLDGEPLTKIGVLEGGTIHGRAPDALGPGEYFFDYDSDTILLGSDPEGHLIETSVAPGGIGGTARHVTIRGLVVEQTAGYGIDGNQYWSVKDNESRLNHTTGIGVSGFSRITRNLVHQNGKYGLTASGRDVVVKYNRVESNNLARFSTVNGGFWDAGGSKFVFTEDMTLRGNYFVDNFGDGIWLDLNNSNADVYGNHSSGNQRFGVFVEISYRVSLHDNYIGANGDYGIFVNSSSQVEVVNNLVTGGVVLAQQSRGEGTLGPHVVEDSLVRGNVVDLSTGRQGVLSGADVGDGVFTEQNNSFEGNIYHLPSRDAENFLWSNQSFTVQEWVGAGLDTNGEFYAR